MNFPIKRKPIRQFYLLLTIVIAITFVIQSCGPARHLEKDERLLKKVELNYEEKKKFQDDLYSLSKQKPNRKLLGLFKVYLGIYNLYYDKEDSKIKNKLGEAPVIYDSTLHEESTEVMEKYLNNRGYYQNAVDYQAKIGKKRASVEYQISKGERFTIQKLDYEIPNNRIRDLYFSDSSLSKIKVGGAFDLDLLKAERVRIESQMKNEGYYDFSREFVVFKADTFMESKTAKITLSIKNRTENYADTDSTIEKTHQIYKISKVYVRMNFDERFAASSTVDTTRLYDLIFTESGEPQFRYKVVSRAIFIRPGQIYRLNRQEATYRHLSSLGVFSYVSIKYEDDYDKGGANLVVYIDLNPRKQKSYTLLTEGTNNGGNLGLNGDISFQNRNTFGGAELLNVQLSGGIEAQQLLTDQNDNAIVDNFLPFNTLEIGPEVSLRVPRFLLPVNMDRYSAKGDPSTTFGLSFNYQRRPDFRRNVTKTYMSYSWNESATKTHIVSPLDLSYIKLDPSPEFTEVLRDIRNPFLRNSYTDNLILAFSYSFILNTKQNDRKKDDFFFRWNAETAGNFLSLVSQSSNLEQNEDGSENIAGIRYAQYVRSDFDFRYYQRFEYNTIVYRFASGLGIPYGNSSALPFEKSFFAGGANSIRAWLARDLGPGTLTDSVRNNVDQIGNLSIEANLEIRFPITDIFEGAAFADLGNIWNYDQEDSREETQFKLKKAWDGTAIGLGLGLRLNFTFFVIRLDFAAPFKDPGEPNPRQLKLYLDRTNLNFGIGYPF